MCEYPHQAPNSWLPNFLVILMALGILASVLTTTMENLEVASQEDVDVMIEDCQNRESKLSDWEAEFIDSLDSQVRGGSTLTDKQLEKLEQIWDRIT